jgi:hypothetical protein
VHHLTSNHSWRVREFCHQWLTLIAEIGFKVQVF